MAVNDREHDLLDQAAVDLGGGRQDHAVAEKRRSERLHVVGNDEVAAVERRPGPRCSGQHGRRARARAGSPARRRSRVAAHQRSDIVDDLVNQPDRRHGDDRGGEPGSIGLALDAPGRWLHRHLRGRRGWR